MADGIGASLEAMRSDAKIWDTASGDLQGPTNTIAGLTVEPAAFSMWAVDRGIDSTYDEARTALQEMLKQASEYFTEIGKDLTEAASQYEKDDQQGKHDIQNAPS